MASRQRRSCSCGLASKLIDEIDESCRSCSCGLAFGLVAEVAGVRLAEAEAAADEAVAKVAEVAEEEEEAEVAEVTKGKGRLRAGSAVVIGEAAPSYRRRQ